MKNFEPNRLGRVFVDTIGNITHHDSGSNNVRILTPMGFMYVYECPSEIGTTSILECKFPNGEKFASGFIDEETLPQFAEMVRKLIMERGWM